MTPPESPRDRAVDAGDNSDQKQGEQWFVQTHNK